MMVTTFLLLIYHEAISRPEGLPNGIVDRAVKSGTTWEGPGRTCWL